jgi:hypothetical protein
MKKKDLIGKTIYGFYSKGPEYMPSMDKHIGQIGTIKKIEGKFALVSFVQGEKSWWYPLKQVKKNLVTDFFIDSEEQVEFTIQEIADIIDIPVELLRIKL